MKAKSELSCLGLLIILPVAFALGTGFWYALWNFVISPVFHAQHFNWLQCFVLMLVVGVVFSSVKGKTG